MLDFLGSNFAKIAQLPQNFTTVYGFTLHIENHYTKINILNAFYKTLWLFHKLVTDGTNKSTEFFKLIY